MLDPTASFALANRVAGEARGLGIQTALIGASALAANNYLRGTVDMDLASRVDLPKLRELESHLQKVGLRTRLSMPDEDDNLGGVLRVWEREDDEGDPIDVVEVVNFLNPFRPRPNPAADAIRNALPLDHASELRYAQLADLVALKLYAGALRDLADVVELLVHNPAADLDEIRTTCKRYGFDAVLEDLISQAHQRR
jgi:hypothetical protein